MASLAQAQQEDVDPHTRSVAEGAASQRLIALWLGDDDTADLHWGLGGARIVSPAALQIALGAGAGGCGSKIVWGTRATLARLRALGVAPAGRIEDLRLLVDIAGWRHPGEAQRPTCARDAWLRFRRLMSALVPRPLERQLYSDLAELSSSVRPDAEEALLVRLRDLDVHWLASVTGNEMLLHEPPHVVRGAVFQLGPEWLRGELRRQGQPALGEDDARAVMRSFFERHPSSRVWLDAMHRHGRRGFVETRRGRRVILRGSKRPQVIAARAEIRDAVATAALVLHRRLGATVGGAVREVAADRISIACPPANVGEAEALARALIEGSL